VTKKLLLRCTAHEAAPHSRFFGRTALSLFGEGCLQETFIAPRIKKRYPDRCFCSALKRYLETCGALSGMPIEVFSDLREADSGSSREKKNFDEMQRLKDFLIRIRRAASAIGACPEITLPAVPHTGVVRALLCHLFELQPRHSIHFKVNHASPTFLELFGDRGVLAGFNHSCFREGA